MYNSEALDVKEICKQVSADLKSRRITHKEVAEMIGTTKQTVTNQLTGKKRFSVNMAQKFSEKLGYSAEFLLYGLGPLYAPGRLIWHPKPGSFGSLLGRQDDPIMKDGLTSKTAAHILEIINDKVAIECFEKYWEGNLEESNRLMEILVRRYCYNIPLMTSNPAVRKAFVEARAWFRKVEVLSAKRLVLIEQKVALGEVVDVDAEVERFRQRVIWIKQMYKEDAIKAHPEISPEDYLTDEERESLHSFFEDEDNG